MTTTVFSIMDGGAGADADADADADGARHSFDTT
jgi:hypothetical protein